MSKQPEFDVFLSYSAEGEPWAHEFADALRREGVRAWYGKDEIALGDKVADKIESALRDSPTLVFIVTPGSVESPWTFFEIGAAIAGEKRIIPVLVDDLSPEILPRVLRQYQYLRESSPSRAAERLAAVLKPAPADAAA